MLTTACESRPPCRPVAAHRSLCRLAPLPPPMLSTQSACRLLLAQVGRRVDKWLCIAQCVVLRFFLNLSKRVRNRVDQCLRKSASVWTIACASLSVLHRVSASTSACDSTSVLTSACAIRPSCRSVAAHISVCRQAFLLQLCLRLSQRVDQWLRIAHCVALRHCR